MLDAANAFLYKKEKEKMKAVRQQGMGKASRLILERIYHNHTVNHWFWFWFHLVLFGAESFTLFLHQSTMSVVATPSRSACSSSFIYIKN